MTQTEIKEKLHYRDGHLYWNQDISNIKAGSKAGCINSIGYHVIRYNKKLYLAHRLIWTLFNGTIPKGMQIDHINQIRSDNRIDNLRLVSHKQNGRNQKLRSTNTSGICGVSWLPDRKKWVARIWSNGKGCTLGYFKSKTDAVNCRKQAQELAGFSALHGKK